MSKEISEEKILGSKFTLSLQTIITGAIGLSSVFGMYFALKAEIQLAKELPTLESLYESEYPSKPQGYNHPASYEQYKSQVGALQEDVDQLFEMTEALEEDLEELDKKVMELRIKVK